MEALRGHWVAVVGGACAGSTAAAELAARGIHVAVFEQQDLPFGKIEDGLPKWHVKLRDKEEGKIVERLNHPNIHYVPNTCLGLDLDFFELANEWGFSAVLLASGAWRDRPLPVDGVDEWAGKGFYYQNYFVDWFNHYHEPGYDGPTCDVEDNALIIGGGLASIDVAKILMLETVQRALAEKGVNCDILKLEHKGVAAVLEDNGLTLGDLGLKGCTLCYRRRAIDMPLATPPPDADEKRLEKCRQVRRKILDNAMRKYLFRYQECCLPSRVLIDGGRVSGMRFLKTAINDGKVEVLPESEFDLLSPLVISSIGSIPQPIAGIPSRGELFAVSDWETGNIKGFPHVFALGNAVTGRGNIRESELHAREITEKIVSGFLQWTEADQGELAGWSDQQLADRGMLTDESAAGILNLIRSAQHRAGYHGNLEKWIEDHLPARLENLTA